MTDSELLRRFEDLSLPFSEWTHRAHIRVAFLYLSSHPFEEALDRIRANIKARNAANNRPDGPTEGYNETTTVAFMRLVDAMMRAYGSVCTATDSEAFCEAHPQLLLSRVLRLFYSPARRLHPDAKTSYVEPDLAPLPRVV